MGLTVERRSRLPGAVRRFRGSGDQAAGSYRRDRFFEKPISPVSAFPPGPADPWPPDCHVAQWPCGGNFARSYPLGDRAHVSATCARRTFSLAWLSSCVGHRWHLVRHNCAGDSLEVDYVGGSVVCNAVVGVRDREIRYESRPIPVVSNGEAPSAEPGCVAESPKSGGTNCEEAHLREEDLSRAVACGLSSQGPAFGACYLFESMLSLTVGMYRDPWYLSQLCRSRACFREKLSLMA